MSGIFIIAELDGAIADRVRAIQQQFDPKLAAESPPHVTLIGSSGAGPIPEDTPAESLRAAIETVVASSPPLTLRFGPPMRFLQREIVVLPLDQHGPLRALHQRLKDSGIPFAPARWPFTPHCTLSLYPTLTPETLKPLLAQREREPWTLHTLRVYHTREPQPPTLLFDAPLRG
ncbi:MAG TPA: 2'-5' RNA ligase family protein [Gemmatimonadaceae bacterium]